MELSRKEVKNKSLVNLISSYDDRYLSIVQIGNELYFIVFKRYNATVVETKKKLVSAANLIRGQIQNVVKEYKQTDSVANKDQNPYFVDGNPYVEPEDSTNMEVITEQTSLAEEAAAEGEIDIMKKPHWIVKSVTPLRRIFMIDVQSKGMFKTTLTVILHFINKSLNPGTAPKIKTYSLSNDSVNYKSQQEFLRQLEEQSMKVSAYYRRMKTLKK